MKSSRRYQEQGYGTKNISYHYYAYIAEDLPGDLTAVTQEVPQNSRYKGTYSDSSNAYDMVMFMNAMQKAYLVLELILGIPKACVRVTNLCTYTIAPANCDRVDDILFGFLIL